VLTPVYPSTAGVSQAYLRKAIENAVERTPLPELLPPEIERDYPAARRADAREAVRILHHPGVDSDEAALMDGSHPAWTRIKFEELLAQQLAQARTRSAARARRRRCRAAPRTTPAR
jgi:ATP-dependent DNA helicase RecG